MCFFVIKANVTFIVVMMYLASSYILGLMRIIAIEPYHEVGYLLKLKDSQPLIQNLLGIILKVETKLKNIKLRFCSHLNCSINESVQSTFCILLLPLISNQLILSIIKGYCTGNSLSPPMLTRIRQ